MSLGSERDDVWGEEKSQEQGTSDTIDAPSASSFFFPRDSLVKLQVLPLVVTLQLLRRPRELVSGKRIGISIT